MERGDKIFTIALVIVLGFALQGIFAWADSKDTPYRAVVEFSKAYFTLDGSMADRLCEEQQFVDDVDVVEQYIHQAAESVKQRGFGKNFAKSKLSHIETHTEFKGDDQAVVTFEAVRRVAINPVYANVATVFDLNATYPVEAEINVIKENGKWKVCQNLDSVFD